MSDFKVLWTETALKSLDDIFRFIATKSKSAAKKQIYKILSRENQLVNQPFSGQMQVLNNLTSDYRFILEGNHKIIYHIEDKTVYIDLIFDTRQDPEKLKV